VPQNLGGFINVDLHVHVLDLTLLQVHALLGLQLVKLVSERQHLWCFSADLASCPPYAASVIVSIEMMSLADSHTVSTKPES